MAPFLRDRLSARPGIALLAVGIALGAGLPAAAEDVTSPLPAAPEVTRVLLEQAVFWREKGRRDLAVDALRRVYAVAPDAPEVLYGLGAFALQDQDYAAARGWLARLRQIAPGDPRGDLLEARMREATVAAAPATESAATTRVAPAAPIRPDAAPAAAQGDRLRLAGHFAEAYDVLALALGSRPDDPALLAALARLYEDGGMPVQALQVYNAVLTRDPGNGDVIEGAVVAALRAGDTGVAGRWLNDALALSPGEPGLHVLAARVAQVRGDNAAAIASLETARLLRARQLGLPDDAALAAGLPANPFRRTADTDVAAAPETADASPTAASAATGDGAVPSPARRPAPPPRIAAAGPAPAAAGVVSSPPAPATVTPNPAPSSLPRPLQVAGEATAAAGQTSGGLYLPGGQVRAAEGRPASLTPAAVPTVPTPPSGYPAAVVAPAAAPTPTYPPLPTPASPAAPRPAVVVNDPMSQDIARELAQLKQDTVPFVRGEVGVRNRNGESGLSELTEVHASLSAAISPFDEGRLTATAMPVSLDSGTPEGDGARRFGANALIPTTVTSANHEALATIVANNAGVWNLLTPTEKQILGAAITTPEATTLSDFVSANAAVVAGFSKDVQTAIDAAVAADAATTLADFVNANGTILGTLTTAQQSVIDAAIAADVYSFDTARMASLRRAPTQDDAGVALALAYEIGNIKADVGSTPLGFEVKNVVGGITFAPQLSSTTTLKLTGERRAVTDSLLSYAGTVEPFTGKRWGGVTRTGARVMLSDDDGDVGLYGGAGYYKLDGENVDDNQQMEATVGAYIRPYKTERAELSVGVNLSYLNYEKNLGEFSLGHGGYFSPQNFYSIAFPVEYSGESRSGKWNYTIGGAIGFQSYDKDAAPYFPTNGKLQQILEDEVSAGLISSAYYSAASESGIGGNIHGSFDYAFDRQTTIGGAASFDSSGDYTESSVMVYVKRLLEVAP
ncbi:cellulose synthase subunit BcsC-related outer membrane protein [Zavarzinia aquatilis]|uniref:Cellulose synthase operon C C-terminal domain-containing protein n=1 Tax=Zavarzinia aquatilis TaxID=2211142 RepID=A0A317E245_9PROT|nr:cellulose synthase subunit BcsC-related outer membrane protein [Zavarzinia aquatilis]PWR21158.1 hypothetical protein DKG74_14220 [Zavarzinia aquatilis]